MQDTAVPFPYPGICVLEEIQDTGVPCPCCISEKLKVRSPDRTLIMSSVKLFVRLPNY
ncbi:hypothetical protein QUA71_19835 [Microcoleus sp. MON1_C5]|uniref:hypothetical protein n=1 Tax=Microcoleus sp. MON1_C5 TaxID=2818828 RepID=UPI002FD47ADF